MNHHARRKQATQPSTEPVTPEARGAAALEALVTDFKEALDLLAQTRNGVNKLVRLIEQELEGRR